MNKTIKIIILCVLFSLVLARETIPTINTRTGHLYINNINNQEIIMGIDGSATLPENIGISRNIIFDRPFRTTINTDITGREWQSFEKDLGKIEWGLFNHLSPYGLPLSFNFKNAAGINYLTERTRLKLTWDPQFKNNLDLEEYQLFIKTPDNKWHLEDVFDNKNPGGIYYYLIGENEGSYIFKMRAIYKKAGLQEINLAPVKYYERKNNIINFITPTFNNNIELKLINNELVSINYFDRNKFASFKNLNINSYTKLNNPVNNNYYSLRLWCHNIPNNQIFAAQQRENNLINISSITTINFNVDLYPEQDYSSSLGYQYGLAGNSYEDSYWSDNFNIVPQNESQYFLMRTNKDILLNILPKKDYYIEGTKAITKNISFTRQYASLWPYGAYIINLYYRLNNNDAWKSYKALSISQDEFKNKTKTLKLNIDLPISADYKIYIKHQSENENPAWDYCELGRIEIGKVSQVLNITKVRCTPVTYTYPKPDGSTGIAGPIWVANDFVKINLVFPAISDIMSNDPSPLANKVSDIFSVSINTLVDSYYYPFKITYQSEKTPKLMQYIPSINTWISKENLVIQRDPLNKYLIFQAKAHETNNFALVEFDDISYPKINIFWNQINFENNAANINNYISAHNNLIPDIKIAVSENYCLKKVLVVLKDKLNNTVYTTSRLFDIPINSDFAQLPKEYLKNLNIKLPANSPFAGIKATYNFTIIAEDSLGNQSICSIPDIYCIIPTSNEAQYEFFEANNSAAKAVAEFKYISREKAPTVNFYQKIVSSVYLFELPTTNVSFPSAEFSLAYETNAVSPQVCVFSANNNRWLQNGFQIISHNYQDKIITFRTSYPGYYAVIDNLDITKPKIEILLNGKKDFEKIYKNEIPAIDYIVTDNTGLVFYKLNIIREEENINVYKIDQKINNPDPIILPSDLKKQALVEVRAQENISKKYLSSIAEIDEITLDVYSLDPGNYHLEAVANDIAGNSVYYNSSSFVIMSVVDMSDFIYGPNPFNPGKENFKFNMTLGGTAEIDINIYTASGEKIWKYEGTHNGNVSIKWDGYNIYDELVANGIYHCFLRVKDKANNQTYKKKFIIAVLK